MLAYFHSFLEFTFYTFPVFSKYGKDYHALIWVHGKNSAIIQNPYTMVQHVFIVCVFDL